MSGRLLRGLHGWRAVGVLVAAVAALLSSAFAGVLIVSALNPDEIEVRVFLDDVGDGLLDGAVGDASNPLLGGVVVRLWADDGGTPGQPEGGDTLVGSYSTNGAGEVLVSGLSASQDYWVGVEAATISPPGGATPIGATWLAEQTYGPAGSIDSLGALTPVAGPNYGGRDPVGGDAAADITQADHLALVRPGGDVAEFGFSFNVVVNVEGPVSQGSLQQFVMNARHVEGPNGMRFVPVVAPNITDGAAQYWRIDTGAAALSVNDDDTTIDGTAYAPDGSVRDPNPGGISPNGGSAVGTRGATLPVVDRPELQVLNGSFVFQETAGVRPVRSALRNIHVEPQNAARPPVDIVGTGTGNLTEIEVSGVVLGTVDPTTTAAPAARPAMVIRAAYAPGLRIEASFLANATSVNIVADNSASVEVRGNEITGAGTDGFHVVTAPGMIVEGNRVSSSVDFCLDVIDTNVLITDNTFVDCGNGAGQSAGVRIGNGNARVEHNVFSQNNGPGIVVAGENTSQGRVASRAVVSRNSFDDNDSIAIDNHIATTNNLINGDGISVNDGTTTADAGSLLLDYPVLTSIAAGAPGTVDISGTACANCVVEVYTAQGGADDIEPISGNTHGEGLSYLQSATADGSGNFTVPIPTVGVSQITATATDVGLGATSEFSANLGIEVLGGQVLLDPNADADLADAVPVPGATVRVYQDVASAAPGAELPLAGDPLVATLTTAADGRWTFPNATSSAYWVTIDSRTIAPTSLNGGSSPTDAWAEQTVGPAGSLRADGAGGTETSLAAGPAVGGRTGDGNDDATSLLTSEHVFRVPGGAPSLDLDTGFSFNVVTNTAGGTVVDYAPAEVRTQQGTLRQFLLNAATISGANTMRFVPAVPADAGGGGLTWWRSSVTEQLPALVDSSTAVDGQAYSLADPSAQVDPSASSIVPAVTVGTTDAPVGAVDTPEFELWGDRTLDPNMDGFVLQGSSTAVRRFSMIGFDAGITVGAGAGDTTPGFTIEGNALSFDVATAGDPGSSFRLVNAVAMNGGVAPTILGNAIGYTNRAAVSVADGTDGFVVQENQILSPGMQATNNDGVGIVGSGTGTVSTNLIRNSPAYGVDVYRTSAAIVVSDNTIDGWGSGGLEEGGLRIFGTGSTVERNVIANGVGSPIVVVGSLPADTTTGRPAVQTLIQRNLFGTFAPFASGNPATAIDLVGPSAPGPEFGDGPTANDGADGCGYTADYGNAGIDHPVVAVEAVGSSWVITGTGCPGSVVELYAADSLGGPPTFPAVQVSVSGAGTINTTVPLTTPALAAITHLAASQTNSRNTSEFGPAVEITNDQPPVIVNPGTQGATELSPFTLALVGSDPDSAPIAWAGVTVPPGMTVDASTGAVAWTPSETDGGTTVTVTVSLTGGGKTVSESFDIVVAEDDQPPAVDPIPDASGTTGVPQTETATGTDPDTPAATLTWSLLGVSGQPVPPGMSIDPGTGEISYTPSGAGLWSVEVVATQPNAVSGSTVWNISVADPIGPPPVVTPPADQTINEGQSASLAFTATDATSFTLLSGPPEATIDAATGVVSWSSGEPDGGSSFTFTVQAGGPGGTDSGSAVVTVVEVNSAPTVTPVPDQTVVVGGDVVVALVASDSDTPAQGIAYTVLAGPSGLTVDGGGRVLWSDVGPVGTYPVTVRVSDSGSPSRSADASFTIRVINVPTTTTSPTTLPPPTTSPTTTPSTTVPPEPETTTSTRPAVVTTTPTVPPDSGNPDVRPSLPVDDEVVNVPVPDLRPPIDDAGEPTLSLVSGIPGLLQAPGAFQIPPTTIGLAGAWIFVLGVPLVLWERKRAVNVVTGVDAHEELPVYATRNSTHPFAYLRCDAAMLWSKYRIGAPGKSQRIKVDAPFGAVWIDREHLEALHKPIEARESR